MLAILRILFDGQAWLYANQLKLQRKIDGQETTEKEFQAWENEWKETSTKLIGELGEAVQSDN